MQNDSNWNEYNKTFTVPSGTNFLALTAQMSSGTGKGLLNAAAFDGFSVTRGACVPIQCGARISRACTGPLLQDWEDGAKGWTAQGGAPVVVSDPSAMAPSGGFGSVQRIGHASDLQDHKSPYWAVNVDGGKDYCFDANIRWDSGHTPAISVERYDEQGVLIATNPLMGHAPTADGIGNGWATPIVSADGQWHHYRKSIRLPWHTQTVRLSYHLDNQHGDDEGASVAYFEGLAM